MGTVTQGIQDNPSEAVGKANSGLANALEAVAEGIPDLDMRDALMLILQQLFVMETAIGGKKANELIIDPIALIRDL